MQGNDNNVLSLISNNAVSDCNFVPSFLLQIITNTKKSIITDDI